MPTITERANFSQRKILKQELSVIKDLNKLHLEEYGLAGDDMLVFKQSVCLFYIVLGSKSKGIDRMGKIFAYYISNGNVEIWLEENSEPITITHTTDFEYFPGSGSNPTRQIHPLC